MKITNKSNKHIQKEKVKVLSYLVSCGTHSPKSGLAQFIVSIVLFVAVVLEMIFFASDTVMNVLLIVVCLLVFINAFRYFLKPVLQFNSLKKYQNANNEFFFKDDHFTCKSFGDGHSSEEEMKYSTIVSVYETSNHLFLFKTSDSVYIVDKKTIENGNIEELRNKLKENVIKKYKVCKY